MGVLKDVSEFWSTVDSLPTAHRRYHYQKAVFSATPFSSAAERYAFAHDIYLFPLGRSAFAKEIIDAIYSISGRSFLNGKRKHVSVDFARLRRAVRESLRVGEPIGDLRDFMARRNASERNASEWNAFIGAVAALGSILIGMIARAFPVFLVPESGAIIDDLPDRVSVEIGTKRGRWFLRRPGGENLFSFDLPPVLFSLYADSGILRREQAAILKQKWMTDFQALIVDGDRVRGIQFVLDSPWFETLRDQVRRKIPAGEVVTEE